MIHLTRCSSDDNPFGTSLKLRGLNIFYDVLQDGQYHLLLVEGGRDMPTQCK